MKKKIILVALIFSLISYGQTKTSGTSLKIIQNQLSLLNISIKDSYIVVDTLLTDKNDIIISVIDSLSIKEESGTPYIFLVENSNFWYIGKFGENAHIPAVFSIKRFPNQDKLIIMKYVQMGQGIVEESLTLFKKTDKVIQQLCPTLIETGLSNSGLCPDLEKCYEYTSDIIKIENNQIIFKKRGTYLDYKQNTIKSIDNLFYLKKKNEEWMLIK